MATFDLTGAKVGVDLTDPTFATFGTFNFGTPMEWNWFSPSGHQIDLVGAGLVYGAGGHATAGTIVAIGIDLGANDMNSPEIAITGLNVAAAPLDDSIDSFWRILDGNDTILGPLAATAGGASISKIFGDGLKARNGASTGGSDTIDAGDTQITVFGDVVSVGAASGAAVTYQGGNDTISCAATARFQTIVGDVDTVSATGKLTGGNDIVILRTTVDFAGSVAGDGRTVTGVLGNIAEAIGGDDTIDATAAAATYLAGDFFNDGGFSAINGGDDTIMGGGAGDVIVGDVGNGGSGTLIGGDDLVFGNGGDDNIVGEVFNVGGSGTIVGGDDELHGGAGEDSIFGEFGNGPAPNSTGGNDELYGDADNDRLFGRTGNDRLDGGTGDDTMEGGLGNDAYVVDSLADAVSELAGEGYDTVNTTLASYTLGPNFERVNSIGAGNFIGTGNALANRFQSLGGDDRFVDVLGGADIFSGGGGTDTIDFRTSALGVGLNFATGVHGGAAAGDSYSAMEKYFGSNTAKDTMAAGGAGRFVFAGFGGNDTLNGGVKNDQLLGGDGNDILRGNADRDSLRGGKGNDRMTGGSEADVYVYSDLDADFGQDTITDYQDGIDSFKVHSNVADDVADFSITGNGTTAVRFTLIADTSNVITLNGAAPITITNADFAFY